MPKKIKRAPMTQREKNIESHIAADAKKLRKLLPRRGKQMAHARELAEAVNLLDDAVRAGVAEAQWNSEESPDRSYMSEEDMYDSNIGMLECLILVNGEVCASLGGIEDRNNNATDEQKELTEAQLAHQCRAELRAALKAAEARENPFRRSALQRQPLPRRRPLTRRR